MSHNDPKLSTEQAAELCRQYVAGKSANELAREYGVSRSLIPKYLRRGGVRRRNATEVNLIDLTGRTFGRLTVLERVPPPIKDRGGYAWWRCRCRCGEEAVVRGASLRRSDTCSCGCYRKEIHKTHGLWRHPVYALWSGARRRAKKAGLPFDLDLDDLHIPEVCPVLGIPLRHGRTAMGDNSPTLDRVDPRAGYTKDNVVIVSARANFIKRNASASELRAIADYMDAHSMKQKRGGDGQAA